MLMYVSLPAPSLPLLSMPVVGTQAPWAALPAPGADGETLICFTSATLVVAPGTQGLEPMAPSPAPDRDLHIAPVPLAAGT